MKTIFLFVFFFGGSLIKAQTFSLTDSVFTVGDSLVKRIVFGYDKPDIRPESKPFLDSLAVFLKKHPEIHLEIATHTDYRGEQLYNNKLSQRRSYCIFDYLISKGADKTKLIAIGYGELKPVIRKSVVDKMKTLEEKEAAHSINRRTTFVIRKINR